MKTTICNSDLTHTDQYITPGGSSYPDMYLSFFIFNI